MGRKKLGWNRDLIRKGTPRSRQWNSLLDAFQARGRKRVETRLPNLLEDLKDIVDSQSQTDPSFKTNRLYTRLSVSEVCLQLMKQKGYSIQELPCNETIRSRLIALGYYPQKVGKTKPQKKFPKPMLSLNN